MSLIINKSITESGESGWSLGSWAYVQYSEYIAKVQITESYDGCAGCIFRTLSTRNCPKCLPTERADKKRVIFKKIDEIPSNKSYKFDVRMLRNIKVQI